MQNIETLSLPGARNVHVSMGGSGSSVNCSLLVMLMSGLTKCICFTATGALLQSLFEAALLTELK